MARQLMGQIRNSRIFSLSSSIDMKKQKGTKFSVKELQVTVDKLLESKGLTEAASIPAVSWSGGKVRVWSLRVGADQIVVRREVYSHNGPRLQLDLGLYMEDVQRSIDSLVEGLDPWNLQMERLWYSHCTFGWSLGQVHSKLLPYAIEGVLPPQEVVFQVIADQSEIGREPICFEAQGKALWFPDDPIEAEKRVQVAVDCLAETGLAAFKQYSIGGLQRDFFDNKHRLDTSIPAFVVEAVYEHFFGDADRALVLLSSTQPLSEPHWRSNCQQLIERMRSARRSKTK
jgi:hypothetical protein